MDFLVAPMEHATEGGEEASVWVCRLYIGPCEELAWCGIYLPWEAK